MPPPSLARQFYDRTVGAEHPVVAIRDLIDPADPQFELYWIDFKGEEQPKPGRTPNPADQERSNRKTWSEALSAFSNTGGGVMIWGLDARKGMVDGRELDCVLKEALVTDPVRLVSKLHEWQGQATDPPLSGVEIEAYAVPEDPGRGFVVCFIPDGPFKPYQSLMTSDRQYYHRAGSSSFVMPRPMLGAMFHPRTRVRFRATAEWELILKDGRHELACRISLLNTGTATAREMFVRVTWKMPGVLTAMKGVNATCMLNIKAHEVIQKEHPLHPGFPSVLCYASWEVTRLYYETAKVRGHVAGDSPAYVYLEVFSENQQPVTIEIPLNAVELIRKEKLHVEADGEDGVRDPEE